MLSLAPIYAAASKNHQDIVFGNVDTEVDPQLADAARIQAVLIEMAFRYSMVVFSQAGALPTPPLARLISKVRSLDTDAIRTAASAHPEGHAHSYRSGMRASRWITHQGQLSPLRSTDRGTGGTAVSGRR